MSRPIIDEAYNFYGLGGDRDNPFSRFFANVSTAVQSKVRIRFNRPFTWSEREHFRLFVNANGVVRHHFNHEDPSELHITSTLGSRNIVERVSAFVAAEYLNIHPKAVKTITPKVEV